MSTEVALKPVPLEFKEAAHLHHETFITKYVFSQDHKMIAKQFLITGMVAIAVALIAEYIRPQWERAAFVVLVALLLATNAATLGTFLREAAFHVVVFAAAWLAVKYVLRFNVLGYFLLAVMTVLIPEGIDLITQPNVYFRGNAYAVIVFAIALVAWPLVSWRRNAISARVQ